MNDFDKAGLTFALDQLDEWTEKDQVSIGQIVDKLGASSFASLMLIFALIAVSPATAIPGVTASVGLIVAILVVQMMVGKKSAWLPGFLMRRELSAAKLKAGLQWLRKPVVWIERLSRRRLTAVLHRPVLLLPLSLVLCLFGHLPLVVPSVFFSRATDQQGGWGRTNSRLVIMHRRPSFRNRARTGVSCCTAECCRLCCMLADRRASGAWPGMNTKDLQGMALACPSRKTRMRPLGLSTEVRGVQ